MSDQSAPRHLRLEDVYVDQVVRQQRFLERHPDVVITGHPEASPWAYWHGQVPGLDPVTAAELGYLLNKLEDLISARDAHARWPGWTFTRTFTGWQAKEADSSELLVARTLERVEEQIAQWELVVGGVDRTTEVRRHEGVD